MKILIVNSLASQIYQFVSIKRRCARLKKLSKVHPLRLVVGASGVCDVDWIDTDIECLNILKPEHWDIYFNKNSIDAILSEHVWEHLSVDEGLIAACLCFKYLKPGGYLRIAVPDGFHPNESYIDHVKPGGTGDGSDDHKVLYDYVTFTALFQKAGFRVELLEYFDKNEMFHSIDWNVKEGKIHRSKRFDERNVDGQLNYTSLILDVHKDA